MANIKSPINFIYPALFVLLIAVLGIVYLLISRTFQTRFQQQSGAETSVRQIGLNQQTFTVKKITIKDELACQTLTVERNGSATQTNCDNQIEARDILSNEIVQKFLNTLTQEEFDTLETDYYSPDLDLTITIETNYGTKTITINSQGSAPIDDNIQEIIEGSDDIEEEITQPPTSPPPSANPTPSPTPPPIGGGPTPTPGPGASPTPTPTPLPPGATPEPFRCDMLGNLDVTVSNIRCLEDQPGQ